MAYASSTGAPYVSSSCWKTVGDSGLEHDLMKRIAGRGDGVGFLRRIWWMVGTAVYQLARWVSDDVYRHL